MGSIFDSILAKPVESLAYRDPKFREGAPKDLILFAVTEVPEGIKPDYGQNMRVKVLDFIGEGVEEWHDSCGLDSTLQGMDLKPGIWIMEAEVKGFCHPSTPDGPEEWDCELGGDVRPLTSDEWNAYESNDPNQGPWDVLLWYVDGWEKLEEEDGDDDS
jgi:hypothetical protein